MERNTSFIVPVNNNLVKKVLCKYKKTFRDKVANAYYDMFEEL